ncbi:MAG: sulfotransferase domain-containing protein [Pseudomonadota bacterium]
MPSQVLGIGGQKCASSWLHAIAGSHPDIAISDPKEVDFFSYYFDRGYQWYDRHFPEGSGQMVRFESSPSYMIDPRSASRAAAYNPEMKILALLRDPVKRAFSNHMHEIIKGHIPVCPFEDGMQNNPCYLDQGLFGKHLTPWFDAFPRDQIKVMFAEDISSDAATAAVEAFTFMGVDPTFDSEILTERRNESDRAKSPALRKTLRAGGDWLRRQGLEDHLAKVKRQPLIAKMMSANSIQVRDEIPPMQDDTRAMLVAHFADDVATLRDLLQADPPWKAWTAEKAA